MSQRNLSKSGVTHWHRRWVVRKECFETRPGHARPIEHTQERLSIPQLPRVVESPSDVEDDGIADLDAGSVDRDAGHRSRAW